MTALYPVGAAAGYNACMPLPMIELPLVGPVVWRWDVLLVGVASVGVGFGLGAALFLPHMRKRRAYIRVAKRMPPRLPPGPRPGDKVDRQGEKMHQMNQAFVRKLAAHDPAWDPQKLHARVAACFMAAHESWTERDPNKADQFLSKGLHERRKRQLEHQKAIGKRDVIKDLRLHDVDLVYVSDREGTKDDEFWAIVTGEMVIYDEIAEWDKYRLACGAMTEAEDTALQLRVAKEFRATSQVTRTRELWKFLREGDAWLLDEVSHDLAEVDDMPKPFSDDVYAPV